MKPIAKAVAAALTALLAVTLVACGSSDPSTDAAAGTTASPSAASTATSSPTPTEVTVVYTAKQTAALEDAAFAAGFRVVKDREDWRAAPAAVLKNANAFVKKTITTFPEGGRWAVERYSGEYGGNTYIACTSTPEDIVVRAILPKDGKSFAVSTTTHAGTAYIIYNSSKAGKKPFDKNGYNTVSGACAEVPPPTPSAGNVVKGTF